MLHSIVNIKSVDPYTLTLEFANGETKQINLESKLKEWSQTPNSKYYSLLDPEYFKKVKLDEELETIYWDNGIDFCPDTLYSLSK